MKFSEQWLREWVDPKLSRAALGRQMTMAGLEVDAIEPVAGAFSGVVVAEILSAEPHPDADRLRLCRVAAGADEALQIVCAAPNARAGLKAPLATVGAVLPGGLAIKAARLRGVESRGMLCAGRELGLSEDAGGLLELPADADVGRDLRAYLGLDDASIEIALTPNRADCLSLRGIAREVGALNRLEVREPPIAPAPVTLDRQLPLALRAGARCPRYLCRVIEGVDLRRPSPLWLQERLRRGGLRSIDAAVDITNYLLLELGQPMHAFDLDRLRGGVVVREARAGETLTLLNERAITLDEDNLVIADHAGPVALAGIMGGADSALRADSTRLLLESAFFAPVPLSGQARAFGLHTDASHRFERGVDYALQRHAMERATQLLLSIVGGAAGPISEALDADALPGAVSVALRRARIERLLGVAIADNEVEDILSRLGLRVRRRADGWACDIPTWRFDLRIEADLIEELARVHGYDRLPSTRIRAALEWPARPEQRLELRTLRGALTARDFNEAITYSFVDEAIQRQLDPHVSPVALSNPIAPEHAVMRSTLLAGLLRVAQRNVKRQQARVRLFETGLRFVPSAAGLRQDLGLGLLATGPLTRETWSGEPRNVDFYDLKGDVQALLALTGEARAFRFEAGERAGLHPGQTALIYRGERLLGAIGVLHPSVHKALDFDAAVVLAELDLDALTQAAIPAFAPVSRYPALRRDLALIVDNAVVAGELLAAARAAAGPQLTDLTLFDLYRGKGIDRDKKSLAIGLTFRAQTRTLDEHEINRYVQQVVDSLKEKYAAELRGQGL